MYSPQRVNSARKRVAQVEPLQPPVGGWDAVSSLAKMPPDRAIVLDNWFPTPADVRVRNGSQLFATGMGSSNAVESLLLYTPQTAIGKKMFAAANGSLWDVSTQGAATVTTVTGMSNNRWQYINFATASGHYLFAANGANDVRQYDGSSWSTPSYTGFTSADIIHLNVHKERIWLIPVNSMKVYYLAAGAISGAGTAFLLGEIFNKGGYVVAMATWTVDGGRGSDDLAVFISSEGQVAVYNGTDPASADTWALVGTYDLGPPIGRRCFTKVGGDLALINIDGVLPLTKALGENRESVKQVAISQRITNAMNEAARSYRSHFGWEMVPYPRGTMAILNVPIAEGSEQHQYVMNTLTGAWCRFKGMNANCWAVFNEDLYFGDNRGNVIKADTSASDLAEPIDAIGQCAYDYYKYRGLKEWTLLQVLLTTSSEVALAVGMSTDFRDNANLGTPTSNALSAAVFDSAIWDTSVFGADFLSTSDWAGVHGLGMCGSVNFRAITGVASGANAVWGSSLWGTGIWAIQDTSETILRINGFHALWAPGEVL